MVGKPRGRKPATKKKEETKHEESKDVSQISEADVSRMEGVSEDESLDIGMDVNRRSVILEIRLPSDEEEVVP